MRFRRGHGLLLAAVLLTGCNDVTSEKPWFTPEDAVGAPQLRDGLWATGDDPDCSFDEAKPIEQWPDCADPIVVRGNEYFGLHWESRGSGKKERRLITGWSSALVLLVAGRPMILQVPFSDNPPSEPEAADDGTGTEGNSTGYNYAAVAPTETDEAGRIVAFRTWPVLCGPPPASRDRYITDRPFPGIMVDGDDCQATDVQALRKAAALSESFAVQPDGAERRQPHWVRDGWR